jgi:hypothetical protein
MIPFLHIFNLFILGLYPHKLTGKISTNLSEAYFEQVLDIEP